MATKVLIAHGNTQRLKRAVTDLQARGFEVAATPDGGDAFARFFEEDPDIVICSEGLPGLSGVNFARMVHSQAPHTAVVLLVEGEGGEETRGLDVEPEPLDVERLCARYPSLAPLEPVPAPGGGPEAAPPSAAEVFVLSALKRFQRGSNLLVLLDEPGILAVARMATQRTCADGELVLRQGDPGDSFYLVVEGQVRVTLREQGDTEVARIAEGGFFGEMALLGDQVRSASVWSVGTTTLLRFGRDEFRPLLEKYPGLREMLSGVALERSEENLWSVLLADDEVQRSLGDLSAAQSRDGTSEVPASEAGPGVDAAAGDTAGEREDDTLVRGTAAVPPSKDAATDSSDTQAAAAVAPAQGGSAPLADSFLASTPETAPGSPTEVGESHGIALEGVSSEGTGTVPSASASELPPASGPSPELPGSPPDEDITRPQLPLRSEPPSQGSGDDIDLLEAAVMDLRSAGDLELGERPGSPLGGAAGGAAPAATRGARDTVPSSRPAPVGTGVVARVTAQLARALAAAPRRPLALGGVGAAAGIALVAAVVALSGSDSSPADPALAPLAANTTESAAAPGEPSPGARKVVATRPHASGPEAAKKPAAPKEAAGGPAAAQGAQANTGAATAKLPDAQRKELRRKLFALFRAKDYAAAAEVGRTLLPSLTTDWEARLMIADAERNAGAVESALTGYQSFVREFPTNAHVDEAQFWAAEILLGAGKKAEAKVLYQKVLGDSRSKLRTAAQARLGKL